jgi:hypothetical protein
MKAELKAWAVIVMGIVGIIIGVDIENSIRAGGIGLVSGLLISYLVVTFANPASFKESVVGWFTKAPPLWIRFLNYLSVLAGLIVNYLLWKGAIIVVPGLRERDVSIPEAVFALSVVTLFISLLGGLALCGLLDKWRPQPAKNQDTKIESTPPATGTDEKVDAHKPPSNDDWFLAYLVGLITVVTSPISLVVSLIAIPLAILVYLPELTKRLLNSIHADRRLQFIGYACGGVIVAKIMASPFPMLAVFIAWGLVGMLIHRYVYRPARNPSV